jgi:hypothetical protein
MASFSTTEAAFEGFRLTREHPRAVLAWIAVYFVFTMVISLLTISWVGSDFLALQALSQSTNPDATALVNAFAKLGPYLLVVLPLEAIFFAVLNCAIYRAVLRPFESGMGYFRLGRDEFRMIALAIIMFVLWLAALFVLALIVSVAASTLGMGGTLGAFIGGLVDALALCAAIWAFVRLSLAAPMTFDQRRLVVFGSWSFTRGSFWPLVGAYVLASLLGVVIFLLLAVISSAIIAVSVMATGGSLLAIGHDFQADVSSVHAFLTFPTLLSQLLTAAMMTIYYVIVLSPSAIAYLGLAGRGQNAEVFA